MGSEIGKDIRAEDPDEGEEEEEEEESPVQKPQEAEASLLRGLMKARTVVLSGEIDKKLAEKVTTYLLVLDSESHAPIKLFVDSPGGDADAGFAILDMVRFVESPVLTISNGLTASAGVIILLAAPKEQRLTLPNSRFLIHQPSSGMFGVASDIKIHAEEILKLKQRVIQLIATECGQTYEKVEEDIKRDRWLSPEEARDFGLVSRIIRRSSEI
ncbi:MAG: ATP-dependent Clp protease proteolytic subunit [Planctomycetes bacterium]|nr:ATP-dependent Clp protease proteolytic subunit [Planctomycetota bacterium]